MTICTRSLEHCKIIQMAGKIRKWVGASRNADSPRQKADIMHLLYIQGSIINPIPSTCSHNVHVRYRIHTNELIVCFIKVQSKSL